MESLGFNVLKNYGLLAFVIFAIVTGGTVFIKTMMNHFMTSLKEERERSERKDALLVETFKDNARTVKEISDSFTATMNEYNRNLEQLYNKHDGMAHDIREIKKKINLL